jgi:hypothetical protein
MGLWSRIPPGACMCVVNVVCYQVVVSTTDRSFIHRSPTECSVCECGLETSAVRRSWSTRAFEPWKVHYFVNFSYSCYHELAHCLLPASPTTMKFIFSQVPYALCLLISPFRSYIGRRPTVWFSSSVPMSEDVRHDFCCVCSPAVGACPTLFLM